MPSEGPLGDVALREVADAEGAVTPAVAELDAVRALGAVRVRALNPREDLPAGDLVLPVGLVRLADEHVLLLEAEHVLVAEVRVALHTHPAVHGLLDVAGLQARLAGVLRLRLELEVERLLLLVAGAQRVHAATGRLLHLAVALR